MRNHKYIRIFVNTSLEAQKTINLDKERSHYLVSVMRHRNGDKLYVFDGISGEYEAEIISDAKNNCIININTSVRAFNKCPDITLCYAPVKNVKGEFIIQKATELGVANIQPMITQNTIKTGANIERYNAVAIEAAEQCERIDVPVVKDIIDIKNLLPKLDGYNILFCDESGQGTAISKLQTSGFKAKADTKWAILIGPEGGFSKTEIEQIYKLKNVCGVGLGPRILRADTAIITALALWQNYFGDFNKLPEFRG